MENICIPFYVKNTAVVNKRPCLCPVAKSKNIYTAEFVFSPMWDGVTAHVQFSREGQQTVDVLIIDGTAQIPNSMLSASGTVTVCVYGGDLVTTTSAKITVLPSDYQSTAAEPPKAEQGFSYVQTPSGADGVQSLKMVDGTLCYLVGESFLPLPDAYQAAKAGGFGGTDEEFCAMLAGFPACVTQAETANEEAQAAKAAAQAAAQSAQAATVTDAEINAFGHLILTLSGGTTIDCGYAKGDNGSNDVDNCATANIVEAVSQGSVSVTDADASNLRGLLVYGNLKITGTANPDTDTKRTVSSAFNVKVNGLSSTAVRDLYAVGNSRDTLDLISGEKNIYCAQAELSGTDVDGTYVFHTSIASDSGTVYVYRLDNAAFGLIAAEGWANEVSVLSDSFETGIGRYSSETAQYGRVYGHHQLHSIFFCTHIAPGTGTAARQAKPFTDWLAERYNSGLANGVKIWYKRSTPFSETLEKSEIAFVKGQNSVALTPADFTEIKVSYKQNLGIALDELKNAIAAIGAGI